CIPKKLLVYASRFRDDFEDAAAYGWSVPAPDFAWPTLIANKDAEIGRLEGVYRANLQRAGVELLKGRPRILHRHTVLLEGEDRTLQARVILVAVGGHPEVPKLPGAHLAITSNEAFNLTALPKSILIVGGGYIAVEFAGIFNGLGSETTLVYRRE